MGDPYGLPDLRQLISGTIHLSTANPFNHNLSSSPPTNCYEPIMAGVGDHVLSGANAASQFAHQYHHHHHGYSSYTLNPTANSTNAFAAASDHYGNRTALCGMDDAGAEKGWLGFDAANNRWPRQETLSLLEIRSRLDSRFRDTNQKGPLWNEVSRIMAEEYGYQRSGKKCKEKFENLYKYYKKTKEGKAGRQDGKHYRFFRQLEAICGETSTSETHHNRNTAPNYQTPISTTVINQESETLHSLKRSESHSFSNNSSEFETSSSENNDEDLSVIAYRMKLQSREKQKGSCTHGRERRSSWRAKVEELVDSHMKKIIEKQDAWMEKMLTVIEQREQEMASKEEERKRKESMKFDREVHELWAKERSWVEARDAALMEVVKKHVGKGLEALPIVETIMGQEGPEIKNKSQQAYEEEAADHGSRWTEMEISNLIQLRTGFEFKFQGSGYLENGVWDEIASKMAFLGFDRSANECKQIWDEISISLSKTMDQCTSAKTNPLCVGSLQLTDEDLSHSSSNNKGTRSGYDSCFGVSE